MEMKFDLIVAGYIRATFKDRNERIEIGHSDGYGDQFQELLNEFMLIYYYWKESSEWFTPFDRCVIWHDDMINYSWNIKLDNLDSEIMIEIAEFSPAADYKKDLLKWNVSLELLYGYILESLHEMFQKFGFLGYKSNWCGNFPVAEYLKLKAGKHAINLKKVQQDDDFEWRDKFSLDDEIALLRI